MRIALASVTVMTIVGTAAFAGVMKHDDIKIAPEGAKRLRYDIELGASTFEVKGGATANALEASVDYDSKYYRFESDYDLRGDVGTVSLDSKTRSHSNIDTDDNRWDITLNTSIPAELSMSGGACDATLDLGGIPLDEVTIEMGAASGDIDFSSPNPRRMRFMNVEAGASSLHMYNLGNANCDEFDFDCGAGSFELDFTGAYTGETTISIEVGASSCDIVLPKGVAIQIRGDENMFSSIDVHSRDVEEVRGGLWESDDFDSAMNRIALKVDVGMGSVDIRWK